MGKIWRIRRFKRNSLTGARVGDRQRNGVQPLTLEPEALCQGGIGAIREVTTTRVIHGGHMDSDLVGTPSLEVNFQ